METKNQLTLNFEACYADSFNSCREFIQDRNHQQPVPHKAIAADMDYSPSQLSRKLTQSPNDNARFTLDDLERWIEVTGDRTPIHYLIEKYCIGRNTEELERQIQQLQDQLVRSKQ